MATGTSRTADQPRPLVRRSQTVADLHRKKQTPSRQDVILSWRGSIRFHWESVAAKVVLVSGKPVQFPPDIRAHQVVLVYEAPLVQSAPLLSWYTYDQAVCECEARRLSPFLLEGLRAFVRHVDESMPFDFHEVVGAFGLARVAATLEKPVAFVSAVFDGEQFLDTEDLWKLAAAFPDFDVPATVWRLHDLRKHLLALSGSSS